LKSDPGLEPSSKLAKLAFRKEPDKSLLERDLARSLSFSAIYIPFLISVYEA